jgi:hypothetical protein
MPIRLPKRFVLTVPESGQRNHALHGRRSSGRWKTGWLNSRNGSGRSRHRLVSSRRAGGVFEGWPESCRPPSRREPIASQGRRRNRNRPTRAAGAGAGGAADAGRVRASRRSPVEPPQKRVRRERIRDRRPADHETNLGLHRRQTHRHVQGATRVLHGRTRGPGHLARAMVRSPVAGDGAVEAAVVARNRAAVHRGQAALATRRQPVNC